MRRGDGTASHLEMNLPSLRKVKWPAQGHSGARWQQLSVPGLLPCPPTNLGRWVKRQRDPSGPGRTNTILGLLELLRQWAFVWFRRKGVVKEKTKTIKSICRGNVNTACWVAVHLVGRTICHWGVAARLPSAAVSEQAGHAGP